MKKTKLGIIFTTIILIVAISFYYYETKKLYGNDKDSILKVIKSFEGYEDKQIEILDIKDFNDKDFNKVRIVGFLSDNNPAYAEFHQNQEGNYILRGIESRNNESLSMFIHLTSKIMFVTNYNNKIAKLQVDVNGNSLEQKFTPYKGSVTWVELPPTDKSSYEYRDYKYYDKDGNLIKDIDN